MKTIEDQSTAQSAKETADSGNIRKSSSLKRRIGSARRRDPLSTTTMGKGR